MNRSKMRKWIIWLVGSIWAGTAIGVLIVSQIHPKTVINASLIVSEIPFQTNAGRILSATTENELLVSRIASVQIDGISQVSVDSGAVSQMSSLAMQGADSASCTFYNVRSDGVQLSPPTQIILISIRGASNRAGVTGRRFELQSHGAIVGNLTSQPKAGGDNPGLSCTRMRVNDGSTTRTVEIEFLAGGGNTIHFSTQSDSSVDFRPSAVSGSLDTTIPVIGELRLSRIDRASKLEKTVLLRPAAGERNQVTFEKLGKSVDLDFGDLLTIDPASEFYVRELNIGDGGFQLSLHGQVKDVRVGAGPDDLRSRMPSLLDFLIHDKEYYALIPAIVALIIGIVEKMGILPRK